MSDDPLGLESEAANLPDAAAHGPLIVGVGASAGGVEALGRFFDGMPADIGIAFVVLTHLEPHRETLLSEILARHTSMHMEYAADGVEVLPNHVYVLPSNSILTMNGNRLVMRRGDAEHPERNPIDVFFTSLAQAAREHAIGIVLSGSGADGTLGIKGIKRGGGLTVAQGSDGSGPQHAAMPASAIGSGLVDMVLPVEQMGGRLKEYAASFGILGAITEEASEQRGEEGLVQARLEICEILRHRIGHDFSGYKNRTFMRRVQRRMQVLQLDSLARYVERLRSDADEATLLLRDLLIGVTSFFRDAASFDALAQNVIPALFKTAGAADIVRAWVPGCATGEEVYSIAILLHEHLQGLQSPPRIQLFATDIDQAALAVARAGRYPAPLLDNVSPERLRKYFRADGDCYVVTRELRDLCIFSAHSVVRDPPFSRMDFVSCRNLLIYFGMDLQDNVLPVFHYALKPSGYLFLGPAEGISRHADLFSAVDKKHRIFQRRAGIAPNVRLPAWITSGKRTTMHSESHRTGTGQREQQLRQHVEERVRDQHTPAHIVVEADGSVVYYSPRTGRYLDPQVGAPSRQLLSMARKGLRLPLRAVLREAVEHGRLAAADRIEVEMDDRVQIIRLSVEPLPDSGADRLYLVVFADIGSPLSHEEAARNRPVGMLRDVAGLEQELKETRERLQSTIEEYETALEELKSGNEELVSVNEELQSTNEELETSKEELQSVNEELHTVNQELDGKVEELHRANTDLNNLFESTQVATIFLDRFQVIRSYTPAVTAIFNLIPSDRGRPLTDIAHRVDNIDIAADIRGVLDERKPVEKPVRLRDGNVHYLMRILPYRTISDDIDGVLVTFVNVTAMMAAEEKQRLLVAELNHRVRNMLQVVIGLANQTLHRSTDLKAFERSFMGRMQALARAYHLLSSDGWQNVALTELLHAQLSPFAVPNQRYTVSGEEVVLTANAALALGLIFYELATNATKYGALSVDTGHIDISWELVANGSSKEFILNWRESGGPTVTEPSRHGFGTELLQKKLRHEINGRVAMDFAPAGLRLTLAVPRHEIALDEPS
ncbi:MAG TPA: CheR family methyltransferase [Steroidobacteraceae bacterium]|jgi:two-component system CheB/CheR fusion protein